MEKTFVLAYPYYIRFGYIGAVVTEIEKLAGLSIIEMKCMNVGEDFARKHLANINKKDIRAGFLHFGSWVDYIASLPVVAMIVEGNNSVKKVLGSFKKESPFCVGNEWMVYASETDNQVEKDIKLWFPHIDSKEAMEKSNKVVYMLPKGIVHGPYEQVEKLLVKQHESFELTYELKPNLIDNFYLENTRVFLIKPLAFQKRCVGEILDVIQRSASIRGLTLVKKADHPSNAWPTDSEGHEYGVAVVASVFQPCLKILPGDVKNIDYQNDVFEIGSDYLHQRKPPKNNKNKSRSLGERVLEAASEFFDYGFSAWAYPEQSLLIMFGCFFEASLVGIVSLKD